MIISHTSNVPDSTYFRTGDAEPEINDDGSLTVYDGQGSRRSWGQPGVTSTVVLEDCDLVAIHVGFYHKHGGGQFWRYYTSDGTETRRVTWASLPDETRQRILDVVNKAPGWAKAPGKLRSQYAKPSQKTQTSYKLVEVRPDGAMVSLYDGETVYELDKRLVEAARGRVNDWGESIHRGGYYSHPSTGQVKGLWESGNLVPSRCYDSPRTLALLECEISGTIIRYPNGKMASTYLTPKRVLETIEYQPA